MIAVFWQDKEQLVRIAYVDAEALVKRCLDGSHRTWNEMARESLRTGFGSTAAAGGTGGGGTTRRGAFPPNLSAYSPGRRSRLHSRNSMSDAPLGGPHALLLRLAPSEDLVFLALP
jgi:hypothetical protein